MNRKKRIYSEEESKMIKDSCPDELSPEEQAFRRGYHHGFICGRTQPDLTEREISTWRYRGKNNTFPPGSMLEGSERNINRPLEEILKDLPLDNLNFDEED